jgi:hypothetical protein
MSDGPWSNYQSPSAETGGPWSKYQSAPPAATPQFQGADPWNHAIGPDVQPYVCARMLTQLLSLRLKLLISLLVKRSNHRTRPP